MTKTSKLLSAHENMWVALNKKGNKVLASAKNVKILSDKLESLNIKKGEAVLTWVYPFKQSIAPYNV